MVGNYTAQAIATQHWTFAGGQWQIVKETWDYVTFNVQFPMDGTTFPQWTAMVEGQNPDLVPDKSFEWHAGPYVAASVFAVLGGVIAIGLVEFRKKRRNSFGTRP